METVGVQPVIMIPTSIPVAQGQPQDMVGPPATGIEQQPSNTSVTATSGNAGVPLAPPPRPVFSFYLSELSQYQVPSENYSPFRARLCHALCEAFELRVEEKAEILATRTDLGQFHADNYLGLLQIASDLRALEPDEKSRKKTKTENLLVKDRLAVFNLDLPSDSRNSVFDGMFAYHRLCVTGSLAAAQMLVGGRCDVAINWFGGHTRARKARAVGGCFVNDSVLTCLGLISGCPQILHISMDFAHCDGVEEAFYTSNKVATLSFHSSTFPTGTEEDIGYGAGTGYTVNVPLDPSCFVDEIFVPLFQNIVQHAVAAFDPSAIVFVASPSIMNGNRNVELNLSLKGYLACFEIVRSLHRPLIILGGAGSSPTVAAIGWCAVTARCLGLDLVDRAIPESCAMYDHFAAGKYVMDVPARSVTQKPDVPKAAALETRTIERLAKVMQIQHAMSAVE